MGSVSPGLRGTACAVVSAALFGLIPLFATTLYGAGATGFQVVWGRMGVSVVLMWGFCRLRGYRLVYGGRTLRGMLALAVLYALSIACFCLSLRDTSPGLMSTLYFTYPLMVLALGSAVRRSGVSRRQACALVAAAVGSVLIVAAGGS